MKIAITGASGYIGSALSNHLAQSHQVVGICRQAIPASAQYKVLDTYNSLGPEDLSGVDVLIHAAGVADTAAEQDLLTQGNVETSSTIARVCTQAQVPLIMHVSSVKAAGEGNVGADIPASPETPYGKSKLLAEKIIDDQLTASVSRVAHIRIPMVYSAEAHNSFTKLVAISRSPLPLPIKALTGSRSYCAVENLLNFVEVLLGYPESAGVYYVADASPLPLHQLLGSLADCQGNVLRDLPVSGAVLEKLVGWVAPNLSRQLFSDAEVNIDETRRVLPDWVPLTTEVYLGRMFGEK
ncbi:MAG: NAD-dependent epimerase/dehydratase family protein [Pseudomonadales bacterium]